MSATLQENLLTLLCHSDKFGRIIALEIDVQLFEGDYRTIAERAVVFWRKHQEAPKDHCSDLVADIIEDKDNRRAPIFRRILLQSRDLAKTINTDYVMEQVYKFNRLQRLKDGIIKSAEKLNSQQEIAINEVEQIWNDLLHVRQVECDPGMDLTEYQRVLQFLEKQENEFKIGIEVLDKRYINPKRGEVLLFLGAVGRGKSWFMINVGKHALMQQKKVVHISLEMPADQVVQRYYQNLFAITKRQAEVEITQIEMNSLGQVQEFVVETITPEFAFDSPMIVEELEARINWFGRKFTNIKVVRYPTRSITIANIRAYLDNLEIVHKFIPDMLILDYVGIMKTDLRDHRLSLGRILEDLRGLAVERNMAVVTAQQINRSGASSSSVSMGHIAEDWSLTGTADQVLILSSTNGEFRYGLARILVGKARSEEDKFWTLITQSYKTGQFCLSSYLMPNNYFTAFDDFAGEEDDSDNDETGDDD